MNPYFGKNLGTFFLIFLQRMGELLSGQIGLADLATDEIQIFVLFLVSFASSLVGTFLVLKKMTMLANSLSHTVLLGIVIAYLILIPFGGSHAHSISVPILLIASLITAMITTILTQILTHVLKLQEDASIGLVFTTLFALGIVLVTMFTRNSHLGTEAIMGNVDALHVHDLKLVFWIALLDFAVIGLLYKEFKITTFDGMFAKAQGFSNTFFNYLLMMLTSATVIAAFRAVGVLLVLAFLVGPVLTARLFAHSLKKLLLLATFFGLLTSILSVAMARHLLSVHHIPISTSGLAATLIGVIYLFSVLLCKTRRLTILKHK